MLAQGEEIYIYIFNLLLQYSSTLIVGVRPGCHKETKPESEFPTSIARIHVLRHHLLPSRVHVCRKLDKKEMQPRQSNLRCGYHTQCLHNAHSRIQIFKNDVMQRGSDKPDDYL